MPATRPAIPRDHPQRLVLNDEVHARPPESLAAPLHLSFLALLVDRALRDREARHLGALAERYGAAPPAPGANHFSADLGPFRIKWEQHTEFTRYTFIVQGAAPEPFAEPAIAALPADWLSALAGEVMVATHAAVLSAGDVSFDPDVIANRGFGGNPLAGSAIAQGAATALTDFRIGPDGFSRLLVLNRTMTPRQTGRMVQRLLELDTYRVMALLALPVARQLMPFLNDCERELAEITTALARSGEEDEPRLLDRLTRLQAALESGEADNHFRFGAAAAYHDLVQRRAAELREERIQGLQTFREFIDRRMAPAMQTCLAAAARQESLSQRMARATQLLSTRVAIAAQIQNQAVLETLNRRARMQLRLQQTVEGLSVAAITYYVVGLVGYAGKGLKAAGVPVDADLVTAISIPIVAFAVAMGVRAIRRRVTRAPS